MNRNLLIFAVILLILVAGAYFALRAGQGGMLGAKSVTVKNQTFKVEVADTDAKRIQGLSNRSSLGKDQGMLFVFPTKERHAFWMKDMQFPIDIIFLDDTKVVTIYHSVQPEITQNGVKQDNLVNYLPAADSNRVLELNAGKAKELGLKEGDTITIK